MNEASNDAPSGKASTVQAVSIDPKLLSLPTLPEGEKRFTDVVFYHANCQDGLGAATAHWMGMAGKDEVICAYIPATYGFYPDLSELVGLHVHVLDFSFPVQLMEAMITVASKVTWLDHHKSAIEAWEKVHPEGFIHPAGKLVAALDQTRSGAGLAWDHYNPGKKRPKVINHLEDYDLWRFKVEYSKAVHFALASQSADIATWEGIIRSTEGDENTYKMFVLAGQQVQQYFEGQVESVLEHVQLGNLTVIDEVTEEKKELVYAYVNCNPFFASEAGNMMMQHFNVDFSLSWFLRKDNMIQISYRSLDEKTDVSKLAVALGGGGHRNAAGTALSFKDFAAIFYNLFPKESFEQQTLRAAMNTGPIQGPHGEI